MHFGGANFALSAAKSGGLGPKANFVSAIKVLLPRKKNLQLFGSDQPIRTTPHHTRTEPAQTTAHHTTVHKPERVDR